MNRNDLSDVNILIAEDSQTQLMLLKESLEKMGASVQAAINGKEALNKIKQYHVDLVVSDIEMPEMDGYELCKSIKEDKGIASIPVILLTNLADPKDVIHGIECKADNFLTKPCSEHLLLSSISDALANRAISRKQIDDNYLEFSYQGKRYKILANNIQITDLLLSTYSSALEKNAELEKSNRKLSSLHLELQNKNNQLTKLIEEKNLMLGMAAHDLRNPLSAIKLYSEILMMKLEDHLDEKNKRMIETIETSSTFMLTLVNDLLDVSVIAAGQMRLNLAEHNIIELVKRNCVLNESIAERKNISVHFNTDENTANIICDVNKIEQVLNNLISNAIKYSLLNSKIEVSLTKKDQEVVISVRDHGKGIPENEKTQLFKTFGKTCVKSTAGEPSIGLGLAIAKKIIEEHKGRIWVESEEGKGSTFYFSLRSGD